NEIQVEAWELNKHGLIQHANYAAYETWRHNEVEKGQPKSVSSTAEGLNREEQKRIKREQANLRNNLHKKLKPLQQEYQSCEQELNTVLENQNNVEKLLMDPSVYADRKQSNKLLKEFEDWKNKSELLLEKLEQLETKIKLIKSEADIQDAE
ncbi:MAG: ABC transporter ATP-binding protein, partial [Desulfovibrio sp.]|nr:ABC transporter ATP-binding protein [Desulfovibrio sp.]